LSDIFLHLSILRQLLFLKLLISILLEIAEDVWD